MLGFRGFLFSCTMAIASMVSSSHVCNAQSQTSDGRWRVLVNASFFVATSCTTDFESKKRDYYNVNLEPRFSYKREWNEAVALHIPDFIDAVSEYDEAVRNYIAATGKDPYAATWPAEPVGLNPEQKLRCQYLWFLFEIGESDASQLVANRDASFVRARDALRTKALFESDKSYETFTAAFEHQSALDALADECSAASSAYTKAVGDYHSAVQGDYVIIYGSTSMVPCVNNERIPRDIGYLKDATHRLKDATPAGPPAGGGGNNPVDPGSPLGGTGGGGTGGGGTGGGGGGNPPPPPGP